MKKNMFRFWVRLFSSLSLLLAMCLCSGCSKSDTSADIKNIKDTSAVSTESVSTSVETIVLDSAENLFSDREKKADYDSSDAVNIQLNGETAASNSESVKISEGTITISEEAVYVVSGKLEDGMIIIDAKDDAKIQLVLKDADITSKTSAAIYIKNADKVFITLDNASENTLTNDGVFTAIDENTIDGAVFSKSDLTINGTGKLTVVSRAGHGIVCKDDLVVYSGDMEIHAASHGIDANDSVRISCADITIQSGKDGIHSEHSEDETKGFVYVENGTVTIEAEGDGISSSSYINIENGSMDIITGGGFENGTKASSSGYGVMPNMPNKRFGGQGQKQMNQIPDRQQYLEQKPEMQQPPAQIPDGQPPQEPVKEGENLTEKSLAEENSTEESLTENDESTSMKGLKAAGIIQITAGTIKINSADDSIHSNDTIFIKGGTFELKTGDDGIHADNSLTVSSGKIDISESYEGLEALNVAVHGGELSITSTDDGINAAGGTDASGTSGGRDGSFDPNSRGRFAGNSAGNGSILITDGTIQIHASGDGIDANGSFEQSGGSVIISGPLQGDTSILDYDTSGKITGGTFIGTGSANMAQNFNDYSQGVVFQTVDKQSAGTLITLKDKNGNTILEHTPDSDFELVIVSSPDMDLNGEYTLFIGEQSY